MQYKYYIILLLMVVGFTFHYKPVNASSQTSLPQIQACPKENFNIPVVFENLTSVDSFQLVFQFNPAVISYVGYSYLHPALLGGRFLLDQQAGQLTMNLKSGPPIDLGNGTLIDFIFKAINGTSPLTWNVLQSNYFLRQDTLDATFINGIVEIFPKVNFVLQQIPELVCPRDTVNTASVIATVTGGNPPYTYQWIGTPLQPLSDSIATKLFTDINYTLRITDNNACVFDTTFKVNTRVLNNITIKAEPDTVFIPNPTVTFTVENNSDPFITNYKWHFGDGDSASTAFPTIVHVYDGVREYTKQGGTQYELTLKITNEYGCDTTIAKTLTINDAKLFVPNVFTPNNDGSNDVFKIVPEAKKDKIISYEYVKLELVVYNRWGKKVYFNADYRSDWDGDNLPDGVYYYVLLSHGLFKQDTYKGSVHIFR